MLHTRRLAMRTALAAMLFLFITLNDACEPRPLHPGDGGPLTTQGETP